MEIKFFQTYHLKKYNEFLQKELNNFDAVFEFGGGYGNLAYTFHKINKNCNYVIFDTRGKFNSILLFKKIK